ncbi:hypothetical protein EV191_10487 [Tamaricihabitans halophyticus]|uniref:Uncharacterized protein n=1 Tax=Tamaricihabitans halophyticus TaxID=1262583 RepID=A0A4R2QU86_9PSEU|nr:DUF6463 family protein [Tamaricihabitans halophyticus]TCP53520.1 hypothetical protein EV191_10487 [Tamaricihabitans halophyticus]
MFRRTPGWWLQAVSAAHAGVGVALYRDAVAEIAARKYVNAVPERGDRATAFWFLTAAPALWTAGRLLRSAESAGDAAAQRTAGRTLVTAGLFGSAAMPASGFWAVAAIGAAAWRRGRSAIRER